MPFSVTVCRAGTLPVVLYLTSLLRMLLVLPSFSAPAYGYRHSVSPAFTVFTSQNHSHGFAQASSFSCSPGAEGEAGEEHTHTDGHSVNPRPLVSWGPGQRICPFTVLFSSVPTLAMPSAFLWLILLPVLQGKREAVRGLPKASHPCAILGCPPVAAFRWAVQPSFPGCHLSTLPALFPHWFFF